MDQNLLSSLGIHGLENFNAPILAALATRSTLLMIGEHGCAKTLLAERVAEKLKCSFRHYNTSLLNYDDLAGYPIPDKENKKLEFIRAPGAIWGAKFVLFDEISRARAEIQNKVFPIVHEHKLQGISLDDLEYCWAAMNPPCDSEEMDNLMYSGSWALDMALADRFRFTLRVPGFSDMRKRVRQTILLFGSKRKGEVNLNELIASTRENLKQRTKSDKKWVVKYLDALIPRLEASGLMISGRRARMMYENIFAHQAAEQALSLDTTLSKSAGKALLFSLPHEAGGKRVERGKLFLAHRSAVEEAGLRKNSDQMVLRRIKDPVKRVKRAMGMKLKKDHFSKMVSDTLAGLDLIRRYAWVYHVFQELSKSKSINASTMELLAKIQGNIVKGAEAGCTESIYNGSARWNIWEKISKNITRAKLDKSMRAEHVTIARSIFFFEGENIEIEDVVTGFEDIKERFA